MTGNEILKKYTGVDTNDISILSLKLSTERLNRDTVLELLVDVIKFLNSGPFFSQINFSDFAIICKEILYSIRFTDKELRKIPFPKNAMILDSLLISQELPESVIKKYLKVASSLSSFFAYQKIPKDVLESYKFTNELMENLKINLRHNDYDLDKLFKYPLSLFNCGYNPSKGRNIELYIPKPLFEEGKYYHGIGDKILPLKSLYMLRVSAEYNRSYRVIIDVRNLIMSQSTIYGRLSDLKVLGECGLWRRVN